MNTNGCGLIWAAEHREFLRYAWNKGLSTAAIATAMNQLFETEISKNAVIGQAHRMHLPRRASPIRG